MVRLPSSSILAAAGILATLSMGSVGQELTRLTEETASLARSAKNMHLEIRQSYTNAKQTSLDIKGDVIRFLKYAGLGTAARKEEFQPLTLLIELEGTALSAQYGPIGQISGFTLFTGAKIKGRVGLTTGGKTELERKFAWTLSPPRDITVAGPLQKRKPDDAPFQRALSESNLFECIAEILVEMRGDELSFEDLLVSGLKDWHPGLRQAVLHAIVYGARAGRQFPPRLVEPLLIGLKDPAGPVREAGAEALTMIRDPRALEPLLVALRDSYGLVGQYAEIALAHLNDPRTLSPLLKHLGDTTAAGRTHAAALLGELKDTSAVGPLLQVLSDREVSHRAAEALGKIGDRRAASALVPLVAHHRSGVAGIALARLGDPRGLIPLLNRHADLAERSLDALNRDVFAKSELDDIKEALRIYERSVAGDSSAVQPLLLGLQSWSSSTRDACVRILAGMGSPAIAWLTRRLLHDDENVRAGIADALGRMKDPVATGSLVERLADRSPKVQAEAARALGLLGNPAAVEPLIKSLSDADYRVRRDAARALGNIGDSRAEDPLVACLKDEDILVREFSAEALGKLGGAESVEPLVLSLRDPSEGVRCAAAEALGNIGDMRAADPLRMSLQEESKYVRRACEAALSKLKGQ
jgi:HEAT repeat protein